MKVTGQKLLSSVCYFFFVKKKREKQMKTKYSSVEQGTIFDSPTFTYKALT